MTMQGMGHSQLPQSLEVWCFPRLMDRLLPETGKHEYSFVIFLCPCGTGFGVGTFSISQCNDLDLFHARELRRSRTQAGQGVHYAGVCFAADIRSGLPVFRDTGDYCCRVWSLRQTGDGGPW